MKKEQAADRGGKSGLDFGRKERPKGGGGRGWLEIDSVIDPSFIIYLNHLLHHPTSRLFAIIPNKPIHTDTFLSLPPYPFVCWWAFK